MPEVSQIKCALALAVVSLSCAGARARDDASSVLHALPQRAVVSDDKLREVDEALARDASLDAVLEAVAQRNPELYETELTVGEAVASARAQSRLPDTELMAQSWAVPLAEPYNLGRAQMLMFGVRQQLPGYGVLDARGRAAAEQARATVEAVRMRRVELFAQTRRAYVELVRLEGELELHAEHAAISEQLLELVRARYRNGAAAQQDILRLSAELARLHNDIFVLEQQRASTRALLNALMGRDALAPLGRLSFGADKLSLPAAADSQQTLAARPDVRSAEVAIAAAEATAEGAEKSSRWPTFMVGIDYMYMPLDGMHAYGATVGMTLPWLNPRNDDEVERARIAVKRRRAALASSRNVASYELAESRSRFEAAARSLMVVRDEVLPETRRSFEATRAAYSSGEGDSLRLLDAARSYLDARLEEVRAAARVQQAYADALRAMGKEALEQGSTGEVQ